MPTESNGHIRTLCTVKEREKPSHCNVNCKNESERNAFELVTLAVCTDPVGSVHRRDQAPNALSLVCICTPNKKNLALGAQRRTRSPSISKATYLTEGVSRVGNTSSRPKPYGRTFAIKYRKISKRTYKIMENITPSNTSPRKNEHQSISAIETQYQRQTEDKEGTEEPKPGHT